MDTYRLFVPHGPILTREFGSWDEAKAWAETHVALKRGWTTKWSEGLTNLRQLSVFNSKGRLLWVFRLVQHEPTKRLDVPGRPAFEVVGQYRLEGE